MKVALVTALSENPFEVLGLRVDASTADVRRRVEDLELNSQMDGGTSDERARFIRAAKTLESPAQRAECELFAKWEGSRDYGALAEDHDYALETTITLLDKRQRTDREQAIRTMRAWAGVARHADITASLNARANHLGITIDASWLKGVIGSSVIPALVGQTFSSTISKEPAVAEAVAAFGPDASRAADLIAEHVEQVTGDNERMDALTVEAFASLVGKIKETASALTAVSAQASRRINSAAAHAANRLAWKSANAKDLVQAEKHLEAALSLELSDADRIEAETDLRTIRYQRAWASANKAADGANWAWCLQELQVALDNAPNDDAKREVADSMQSIRNRRAGAQPPRTQPTAFPSAQRSAGVEGMTVQQVALELRQGGKFVVFEYVISVILMTFKRGSGVYFVRAGESAVGKGFGFTLITLLLGWWGIPWGPIYSLGAISKNLSGGHDVTQEIAAANGLNVVRAEDGAWTLAA